MRSTRTKAPYLYTYVMTEDSGFAPHVDRRGMYLTLATCKPMIRKTAKIGDWIVGVGGEILSRRCKKDLKQRLIFAALVTETADYDSYYADKRFKRRLDNIYHHAGKEWKQEVNEFHDKDDVSRDTKANRVLISAHFYYFGAKAPRIHPKYSGLLKTGRGHKIGELADRVPTDFFERLEKKYRSRLNCYSRPACQIWRQVSCR